VAKSSNQQSSLKTPDELGLELYDFVCTHSTIPEHGNISHDAALDIVADLIKKGANPNVRRPPSNKSFQYDARTTAIQCFIHIGAEATSAIIAAPNFDPNLQDIHGYTLAIYAAYNNGYEILDQLKALPSFDPNVTNKLGKTYKDVLLVDMHNLKYDWERAQRSVTKIERECQQKIDVAHSIENQHQNRFHTFEKLIAKHIA
jgi:hypothetical protein